MDDLFVFFLIGVCVGILVAVAIIDCWLPDIEETPLI